MTVFTFFANSVPRRRSPGKDHQSRYENQRDAPHYIESVHWNSSLPQLFLGQSRAGCRAPR
jgi:hypothetical protein